MKIIILKENLVKGLSIVNRFTTKSITLPILNNILLSTESNFLKISATNLEIGINFWSLAQIEEKGEVSVQGKIFQDVISLINSNQINIREHNLNIEIESKKYKTKLKGRDPKDFPIIPKIETKKPFTVNSKNLASGLEEVIDNVSVSQARPELSGILFKIEGDILKLVSTDSFRLSEKKISLKESIKESSSFILPARTARELINIIGNYSNEIRIYIGENQVMFEGQMEEVDHPFFQVVSRLIDGEFPDYEKIIPQKFQTKIIIKKDVLLNEVKKASIFANKINEVHIRVNKEKGELKITAQNPEVGESVSSVECQVEGVDIEISFNYRFLISGLTNIRTPEVSFSLTNSEGPAVLSPLGAKDFFYIVMPIKSS